MYQVPSTVWNEIAKMGMLQTAFAKRMFPLSETKMEEAIEVEIDRLEEKFGDLKLVGPYLVMMPLLWRTRQSSESQRRECDRRLSSLPRPLYDAPKKKRDSRSGPRSRGITWSIGSTALPLGGGAASSLSP